MVTPDAHRTMNTCLGASAYFGPDDVDPDLIRNAQVTFLEGYLFDRPESMDAYWVASKYAQEAGRKVALTLSDLFCVERHHDAFLPLVRERVDILFANEAEACALWGCDEVGAAFERARAEVAIACITMSDKGSVVVAGPETYEVPALRSRWSHHRCRRPVRAGFLYGYTTGCRCPVCGGSARWRQPR